MKEVKFRWATKEEMKQSRYIEWRDSQDMLDYLHNIKHPVTVTLWRKK